MFMSFQSLGTLQAGILFFETAIFIVSHGLTNVVSDVKAKKILTSKHAIHCSIYAVCNKLGRT